MTTPIRSLRVCARCASESRSPLSVSLSGRQVPRSEAWRNAGPFSYRSITISVPRPNQRTSSTPDPSFRKKLPAQSGPQVQRRYIPLSFLILPPILWYLYDTTRDAPPLSPYEYTDHNLISNERISPRHVCASVKLDEASRSLFGSSPDSLLAQGPSRRSEDGGAEAGLITVHHLMVKNPDLMIERPYTPVNDAEKDGEAKLVVKRVKGGEVGRMIHSLRPDQDIGLRGPLPTFTVRPSDYGKIVMISSGTGIAPFLQLLSKLPLSPSPSPAEPTIRSPRLHLIHALPPGPSSAAPAAVANTSPAAVSSSLDWANEVAFLPALQKKHGDALKVDRFPSEATSGLFTAPLPREVISQAVELERKGEKVMVLVCVPPSLMRPLCGNLTATLQQGEVEGLLRDLGLTKEQVWKLE